VKQKIERIRLFCNLVGRHPQPNKRLGVRQAWRVAGISTGHIVPMPDEYIEWWWKLQDVIASDRKTGAQAKVASAGGSGGNDTTR
jgi:hypothetical protein